MGPQKNNDPTENLKIGVRIRPFKADEVAKKYTRVLNSVDNNMITLHEEVPTRLDALREKRRKEQNFAYDNVFSETSSQDSVYTNTTKPLIADVIKGYNATVFAYGPTGTGKTYTMVGNPQQPGIMIRALNDLFKLMQKGDESFTVFMSYLEIYNEVIRDLLVSKAKPLELREDAKTGIIQVAGLTEISTTSTNEVMKLLQIGNQRRSCESTAANATSSRSHALLQINVRLASHAKYDNGEEVKMGRLFMVDLAGSERAKNTQNVGKRLQEGAHINKSLLALGNVINALAEGGVKYVNFRDSKLTRLLKDALTGNCRTVMIAHVSPLNIHREESRNTLIYADRAKKISTKTRQNKVDVGYHISQYQAIIAELREEITRLKDKLGDGTDADYDHSDGKKGKANAQQIALLKTELVDAFKEQMVLRKTLMDIDTKLAAISIEFDKQNLIVTEYEAERARIKVKKRGSDGGIDSGKENDSDEDEPEEVSLAWEDLIYLQNEEKRYAEMKENVLEELEELKEKSQEIEENLPAKITSEGQKELLNLLCKVHELEINQVEMESSAVMKEHELYRRDIMLLHYDRQRALCDQIITKQRSMLENGNRSGSAELEELYAQYKKELTYTNNERIANGWNSRSTSVMSNRGSDKLPPIHKESEKLFINRRRLSLSDEKRISTPLYIRSPTSSAHSAPGTANESRVPSLPPIRGAKDSSTDFQELKKGMKNNNAVISRRKDVRYITLQKPSSVEEIIVIESPKNLQKDLLNKNRPMYLRDTNRRGSLPTLDLASLVKLHRNSLSSSEDESPQRRGRPKTMRTKVKNNNGGATYRRRGKSLTRIPDNKYKKENIRPPQNTTNHHLPIPPNLQRRSKSDDTLTKLASLRSTS